VLVKGENRDFAAVRLSCLTAANPVINTHVHGQTLRKSELFPKAAPAPLKSPIPTGHRIA